MPAEKPATAQPSVPPEGILPMDPLGPPRKLVGRACDRYGREAVVSWCVRLLLGEPARADDPDISWLGGHAGWSAEWPRVWAARALDYVFTPAATPAISAGLRDDSWRVQEMACNVVGHQGVVGLRDQLVGLLEHETERVRRAAARALTLVDDRRS